MMSCALFAAVGAGCAAPLLKEISTAQQAIQTAQDARAEQYASELLKEAKASLDEGMKLGGGQRQEAKELLLRAVLQAEVAAALSKERVTAEKLQSVRDELAAAKASADTAQKAAQAAKTELRKTPTLPTAPLTPLPSPTPAVP
jgi:hypothetical protein